MNAYKAIPATVLAAFAPRLALAAQGSNGCLNWTGKINRDGYGVANYEGADWLAHRASAALAGQPVSPAVLVRHDCDNRKCVNPDHLRVGTQADNAADMIARGRSRRGERSARAKLSTEQVRAIRTSPLSTRKMAAQLGVSQTAVQEVRKGHKWGGVQ